MSRPYNGFTPAERERWTKIQERILSEQPHLRRTTCEACDATQDETGIVQHLEQYDQPDAITGLCHRCHTMLHERFRFPAAFDRYREAIRDGWRYPPPSRRGHWLEVLRGMCKQTWGWKAGAQTAAPKVSTVLDEIASNDEPVVDRPLVGRLF